MSLSQNYHLIFRILNYFATLLTGWFRTKFAPASSPQSVAPTTVIAAMKTEKFVVKFSNVVTMDGWVLRHLNHANSICNVVVRL